jgi:hypothetical protein
MPGRFFGGFLVPREPDFSFRVGEAPKRRIAYPEIRVERPRPLRHQGRRPLLDAEVMAQSTGQACQHKADDLLTAHRVQPFPETLRITVVSVMFRRLAWG